MMRGLAWHSVDAEPWSAWPRGGAWSILTRS